MEADQDGDGKLSFEEFTNVVAKTVSEQVDVKLSHLSHPCNLGYRQADDFRASLLIWAGPGFIGGFLDSPRFRSGTRASVHAL